MAGDFLMNRDGTWYYVRRVPSAFADLDRRPFVRHSLRIKVADDPRGVKARRAADATNAQLEAYWRGMLDGQSAEAQKRYDAARSRARALGFDYATADEIAQTRRFAEILDRVSALLTRGDQNSDLDMAALHGGEHPPALMLSKLFEDFEHLSEGSLTDLSADQRRKWGNPKRRALANLIEVVGDKDLTALTRDDALDFRAALVTRIKKGDVQIDTANKDIGHLNKMLRTVEARRRIGIGPIFGELRIEGGFTDSRVPYDPAFIQDRLLMTGALDRLNPEARAVLYLIVETGLRLSEATNLTAQTIRLDAPVPHVMVRGDGRRMKTAQSAREIPLVGVSLLAAQAHPLGFPRYKDKSAGLSATINKWLDENGLKPREGQTVYSLRHSFEDRLTAVEAPEKLIAALMGHKFHRPKYGAGPSLEQKREWLQRIAFTPPSRV